MIKSILIQKTRMNLTKEKTSKDVTVLPFPVYFWMVTFLAVAGFADSVYLAISHYRVYTDIAYSSFCAISKAVNCDTVSQSSYSIFLGLPVPVWGIFGYMFFLLFLPLAKKEEAAQKRTWGTLFLLAFGFSAYSVILATISSFIIHSYCIMCIVTYAISFLLLFYTQMIRNRFNSEPIVSALQLDLRFLVAKRAYCLFVFVPFFIGLVLIKIFLPAYWNFNQPTLSTEISTGITADGHPWIGAAHPKLVITEYTDYQCFQCKKMHLFIRQLIAQYSEKIRLVHRHFPMDHEFNPIVKEPFHVGSGKMALLAISAATKGKFWQMNDVLFGRARETKTLNIKSLADEVGIAYQYLGRSINDPTIRIKLYRDIRDGLKLNINGTPAFVINDKVYLAQIPPEIIKDALKD
jgi:protein-disulfide isomerase/uncharacterized membrane protein